MKVFTYYSFLNGHTPDDDLRLLDLWRQNWTDQGFEPVILNEYHARSHPKFAQMAAKVKDLPTINPPLYEQACYYRWLAFAQKGGGLVSDWDVFNYCHRTKMRMPLANPSTLLAGYQRHIPSLMLGNRQAMEQVVDGILAYEVTLKDCKEFDRPHVSDMHIFLWQGILYRQVTETVKNYGEEGWIHSPFVHYASAVMREHQPKWKHIRGLRDWKEPLRKPEMEVRTAVAA